MRSAALRGKVPLAGDVFTASLADLLRVHAAVDLARGLLEGARVVDSDGRATGVRRTEPLALLAWDGFSVELWPAWRRGEPDMVLHLLHGTAVVARIIVEVKTGAPKSRDDAEDVAAPTESCGGDPLADYLLDAVQQRPAVFTALVYLTHHPLAPHPQLADSLRSARAGLYGTAGLGELAGCGRPAHYYPALPSYQWSSSTFRRLFLIAARGRFSRRHVGQHGRP
jgi:hypothetical protein